MHTHDRNRTRTPGAKPDATGGRAARGIRPGRPARTARGPYAGQREDIEGENASGPRVPKNVGRTDRR